ncbi:TetR/AcrR family transcriptional regulator [Nonomuraea jabiensis]|uniref:AcrR family transcriptional regulator n=1 Tax=Nonomuraea jabiensis TaxID=882448 RepID=A0A7W9GB52_9ACTN|nr:TetR/AcrR family transcriptional regulator [Nonomuraea jabiensis]MBB5780542.1 AcrR family transcriptional regulator [Nonomuraea jabiensis]
MGRPREFSDRAVVDAAMEVFWEKGYEATSTQDLCERTGLGRGSLYNAFGSKHRLYEEAIRRYAETRAEAQLAMLAEPGSVRARLRDLMLGVIDADMADPGRRGCLALNAATESSGRTEAVAGLVRRQFTDLEQALQRLVEIGQSTGELSADRPPRQVARAFQSAYYGLRVLAKVTDDRDALLDVVEGAVAAL